MTDEPVSKSPSISSRAISKVALKPLSKQKNLILTLRLKAPSKPPLIAALSSHIERLERALRDAKTTLSDMTVQRDEARSSATAAREEVWMARGQIDVLRAQIEAERARTAAADRRAEEVAADRDRWHAESTARRPWWRRLAG